MKKFLVSLVVFITIVVFITTISISTQKRNELQKIDLLQHDFDKLQHDFDNLQYDFDKLQHDFDFLDCRLELKELAAKLKTYCNEISTYSNEILNSRIDLMLYRTYKDYYDTVEESLTSHEDLAFLTIKNTQKKMESSTFSEPEIELLNLAIKDVESSLSEAKKSLNYYNKVLGIYKNWIEIQSQ